jgi:hypothetical protein
VRWRKIEKLKLEESDFGKETREFGQNIVALEQVQINSGVKLERQHLDHQRFPFGELDCGERFPRSLIEFIDCGPPSRIYLDCKTIANVRIDLDLGLGDRPRH